MQGLDIILTIFGLAALWYAGSYAVSWIWRQTPAGKREEQNGQWQPGKSDYGQIPELEGKSTYGL
ncbi:hypothetical protein [Nonomuraea sp. NPDC023979]|uniref:hypothetical protein n=1 Tax=Nonomuraea sp. NPDC023979 TaxID=3154796 RepID=UPI0033C47157